MRGILLAFCTVALGAMLTSKILTYMLRPPKTAHVPPAAAIEFRASTARQWLSREDGQLHRAVLRRPAAALERKER
jgi:hypothetical protein